MSRHFFFFLSCLSLRLLFFFHRFNWKAKEEEIIHALQCLTSLNWQQLSMTSRSYGFHLMTFYVENVILLRIFTCVHCIYRFSIQFSFFLLLLLHRFARNSQVNAHKDVTINNAEKKMQEDQEPYRADIGIFCKYTVQFDMVVFRLLFRCHFNEVLNEIRKHSAHPVHLFFGWFVYVTLMLWHFFFSLLSLSLSYWR